MCILISQVLKQSNMTTKKTVREQRDINFFVTGFIF